MIVKKQLVLMIVCVLGVSFACAQSAIVPAGGTATGNGGSVTYTVGQIVDQRAVGGDKYMIEGVQQPYEIQTVGQNEYPGITLEAVVYPNPTHNTIQLRISNYDIPEGGLIAQLYDPHGKLLENHTISDAVSQFDLSSYASATYQLRVMNGKQLLKTFKIVKTH